MSRAPAVDEAIRAFGRLAPCRRCERQRYTQSDVFVVKQNQAASGREHAKEAVAAASGYPLPQRDPGPTAVPRPATPRPGGRVIQARRGIGVAEVRLLISVAIGQTRWFTASSICLADAKISSNLGAVPKPQDTMHAKAPLRPHLAIFRKVVARRHFWIVVDR